MVNGVEPDGDDGGAVFQHNPLSAARGAATTPMQSKFTLSDEDDDEEGDNDGGGRKSTATFRRTYTR